MYNGSLSCNLVIATLFHQSVLQAQKVVRLEEMVGPGKQEEEPEGEIIVGPSGEALEPLDSGNIPFFLELTDLFNHTFY